jgi:hypothetical protein
MSVQDLKLEAARMGSLPTGVRHLQIQKLKESPEYEALSSADKSAVSKSGHLAARNTLFNKNRLGKLGGRSRRKKNKKVRKTRKH